MDNKLHVSINGESIYLDLGEEYGKLTHQCIKLEQKISQYRHRIALAREEYKDLGHSMIERQNYLEQILEEIKSASRRHASLQVEIEDLENKRIDLIETIEDLEAVVEYKKEEANGTLVTIPFEEVHNKYFDEDDKL